MRHKPDIAADDLRALGVQRRNGELIPILIDGYNLLHAVGFVGKLERSRQALLGFLAASLTPQELRQTTVVFDAASPPRGLPDSHDYRGLDVRFAAGYESADELLEELIRACSAPLKLVVVSSDHRLHKAARRRKAKAIDSDRWYEQMQDRRRRALDTAAERSADDAVDRTRSARTFDPASIDFWLHEFSQGDAAPESTPPSPKTTFSIPFRPVTPKTCRSKGFAFSPETLASRSRLSSLIC